MLYMMGSDVQMVMEMVFCTWYMNRSILSGRAYSMVHLFVWYNSVFTFCRWASMMRYVLVFFFCWKHFSSSGIFATWWCCSCCRLPACLPWYRCCCWYIDDVLLRTSWYIGRVFVVVVVAVVHAGNWCNLIFLYIVLLLFVICIRLVLSVCRDWYSCRRSIDDGDGIDTYIFVHLWYLLYSVVLVQWWSVFLPAILGGTFLRPGDRFHFCVCSSVDRACSVLFCTWAWAFLLPFWAFCSVGFYRTCDILWYRDRHLHFTFTLGRCCCLLFLQVPVVVRGAVVMEMMSDGDGRYCRRLFCLFCSMFCSGVFCWKVTGNIWSDISICDRACRSINDVTYSLTIYIMTSVLPCCIWYFDVVDGNSMGKSWYVHGSVLFYRN